MKYDIQSLVTTPDTTTLQNFSIPKKYVVPKTFSAELRISKKVPATCIYLISA
jgi:hypothetical protein